MNDKSTVRINFENPSKDLIGGLPGFNRPFDRQHQLEIIEKNFLNSQRELPYKEKLQKYIWKGISTQREMKKIEFDTL